MQYRGARAEHLKGDGSQSVEVHLRQNKHASPGHARGCAPAGRVRQRARFEAVAASGNSRPGTAAVKGSTQCRGSKSFLDPKLRQILRGESLLRKMLFVRVGHATVRFPPFSRPYNLLYARPRSCAKSAGLSSQLLRHLGQIGAEHVIAGTFPSDEPNRRSQLSHALFNNWPEEWLTRYLSRGYLLRDPVFLRSKAKADPFYWDELIPFADADSIGCRI
jgi:hypothetical protein